jgi:hypothetical protein
MKKYLKYIPYLIIAILCFSFYYYINGNKAKELTDFNVTKNGKVTTNYYDEKISQLKKENKSLYDSIKGLSDVESAVKIIYKKKYDTDTVFLEKNISKNDTLKTYTYENPVKTDTFNYKLMIGSTNSPSWYRINVSVGDDFTIINRKKGNINQTIVDTKTDADIKVTPFHAKQKKSFFSRFSVGPQMGVYYGTFNKKIDVGIGIGLSFDITRH